MKVVTSNSTLTVAHRCLAALALAGCAHIAGGQTVLPADVKQTCTVSPTDFAKWYQSGAVAPNGVVNPADSVAFQSNSLCAFYQWSEQMFLWFTSPAYGGKGRVFDSPVFYEVSVDSNGKRHLIPNTEGKVRTFNVRIPQIGPKGLQVQKDNTGRLFLKQPLSPGRPKLPTANGISGDGVELGQAGGGGVLMSQGNSLVYYAMQVNDVYAYFLTAQKTGAISATQFPTSQSDLDKVVAFAKAHGKKLPDANALAIETKTSWVDASTVDASKYIVIDAVVPNYDTSNPTKWVPNAANPTKKVKLALVGVHIAGTVAGHPEMIWATFEHNSNSPSATYSYTKTNGSTGTVAQSTTGNWLFCANGAAGPFNTEKMTASGTTITAKPGVPAIGPSNILIEAPWGNITGPSSASNNTAILSLNVNILSMLPSTDVRSKYLLMGATWTSGQIPGDPNPVPAIGSKELANSTMETYQQVSNCFDCHQGGSFVPFGLSHIYSDIQALTLPPAAPGK